MDGVKHGLELRHSIDGRGVLQETEYNRGIRAGPTTLYYRNSNKKTINYHDEIVKCTNHYPEIYKCWCEKIDVGVNDNLEKLVSDQTNSSEPKELSNPEPEHNSELKKNIDTTSNNLVPYFSPEYISTQPSSEIYTIDGNNDNVSEIVLYNGSQPPNPRQLIINIEISGITACAIL